ncbi:uncharacterized protein (DUF302 family) [Caulobacter ginsengisoli]|uniref:Uncharacterized protein (DUF302 family) n=1 Tax=Caulobacter ginsengisoli TaxID=400775 RepID=A0ABU0IXY9_9CAUL|nr:DUF302 domain-containing protein [Caulobacter ginsengisoli]MDQ0466871.1 uncharacterized protein (DUF302 family) [Caulobacter ginsengisoli]
MTRYPTGAPRRMALALAAAAVFGSVFAAAVPASAAQPAATATAAGVIRVKSAYGLDETVTRLKADIASKGIRFFDEIDQSQLAEGAGLPLGPSKLLLFGNPPLGVQFLTSNPYAGLDWPVRMLVVQDEAGQVWVAWTDFAWMADRYGVTDRDAAFRMASEVSASIAGSAQK